MEAEQSRKRRRYTAELKAQIVAECEVPGASVAKVAMAHGINANILHGWRKPHRGATAPSMGSSRPQIAVSLTSHGQRGGTVDALLQQSSLEVQASTPVAGNHVPPMSRSRQDAFAGRLLINKAEKNYNEMRDTMLRAGLSGVGLAIVFHEIEQEVRVQHDAIEAGRSIKSVQVQAREFVRILDGFSELLRKGQQRPNSLKHLIKGFATSTVSASA